MQESIFMDDRTTARPERPYNYIEFRGTEPFLLGRLPAPQRIIDFWRWLSAYPFEPVFNDLLARYITAIAVGTADQGRSPRIEWDLECEGLKIKVSSAPGTRYLCHGQTEKTVFNIAPTPAFDPDTFLLKGPPRRHSDIYVFAYCNCNPRDKKHFLDLDLWDFHLVPSRELDKKYHGRRTIEKQALLKLAGPPIKYRELGDRIRAFKKGK